jgi:hypothetical protein
MYLNGESIMMNQFQVTYKADGRLHRVWLMQGFKAYLVKQYGKAWE